MRRSAALDLLVAITAEQAGYVTTRQAERTGVDRQQMARFARSGDLRRVRHGVYAARGVWHHLEPELSAWLALDPGPLPWEHPREPPKAILSHASAASFCSLGTIVPALPTFTVGGRAPRVAQVEVHTATLASPDWAWQRRDDVHLPVTTAARTIVDLAVAGEEPSYLVRAVTEAEHRGLASREDIVAASRRRPRSEPRVADLLRAAAG